MFRLGADLKVYLHREHVALIVDDLALKQSSTRMENRAYVLSALRSSS